MKKGYDKNFPRRLYAYFREYGGEGAPSFDGFAVASGLTLSDLSEFRKHKKFDEAYRECSEIRRDYLINHALCRRFDPSFVKYLLDTEKGAEGADDTLRVTVETVGAP